MKVFVCPVWRKSLYAQLMLSAVGTRYETVFRDEGGLPEAIACLERGEPALLHLQWEEFFFGGMKAAQAEPTATEVEGQLRRFAALGGRILWTVHNELPHQIPHLAEFMRIRRLLAAMADLIHVHNLASLEMLQGQVEAPLAAERIVVIPIPAYVGLYEAEELTVPAVQALEEGPGQGFVLGFGTMHRQKGFDVMLGALDEDFTRQLGVRLRLAGVGREMAVLQQQFATRQDVDWDPVFVPAAAVPGLFRAAACLVLPYRRVATSGVAILALTLGAIIVAPALPTFRELLPPGLRRFLYAPGDAQGLRDAVATVVGMDGAQRRACRLEGIAVADAFHPRTVSASLVAVYDRLAVGRTG
jgi:beta-1,4-mannosyltransferase